jgi:PAS domain-containing protein
MRGEKGVVKERDYIRHVIESSQDFQMTLDKSGKIMDVNEVFEHIVGKRREDIIGTSICQYMQEEAEEAVLGVYITGRDITDRKKAEEGLKESQRYTRGLIEASLDPLVTISAEGKITDVNHATESFTGYRREKLIGTDFSDYFTDPQIARHCYQQVFREGYEG